MERQSEAVNFDDSFDWCSDEELSSKEHSCNMNKPKTSTVDAELRHSPSETIAEKITSCSREYIREIANADTEDKSKLLKTDISSKGSEESLSFPKSKTTTITDSELDHSSLKTFKNIHEVAALITQYVRNEVIESFKADIRSISDSMKQLSDRIDILEGTRSTRGDISTFDEEEFINEITEREQRSRNLILYDMDEPISVFPHIWDAVLVKNILQSILPRDVPIIKVVRLGGKQRGYARPLRVILPSKQDVIDILRNKNRYSGSVRILQDKTVKQRNHLKDLRAKLKKMVDAGENKTIRYISGVPKIVEPHIPENSRVSLKFPKPDIVEKQSEPWKIDNSSELEEQGSSLWETGNEHITSIQKDLERSQAFLHYASCLEAAVSNSPVKVESDVSTPESSKKLSLTESCISGPSDATVIRSPTKLRSDLNLQIQSSPEICTKLTSRETQKYNLVSTSKSKENYSKSRDSHDIEKNVSPVISECKPQYKKPENFDTTKEITMEYCLNICCILLVMMSLILFSISAYVIFTTSYCSQSSE